MPAASAITWIATCRSPNILCRTLSQRHANMMWYDAPRGYLELSNEFQQKNNTDRYVKIPFHKIAACQKRVWLDMLRSRHHRQDAPLGYICKWTNLCQTTWWEKITIFFKSLAVIIIFLSLCASLASKNLCTNSNSFGEWMTSYNFCLNDIKCNLNESRSLLRMQC